MHALHRQRTVDAIRSTSHYRDMFRRCRSPTGWLAFPLCSSKLNKHTNTGKKNMRTKTSAALLFFAAIGAAAAEETGNATDKNAPSCIDVVVNGERIPPYACLTQKLMPKETSKPPSASEMASQGIVNRPSNQLGLFNYAATSNRMGNTFGTSVYPQRPPATPAVPVFPR